MPLSCCDWYGGHRIAVGNEDGLPYSPRLSLNNGLADSHRLQAGKCLSRLAITGADCSEFVWVNQGPVGTPPERFAICLRDDPGTWPGAAFIQK